MNINKQKQNICFWECKWQKVCSNISTYPKIGVLRMTRVSFFSMEGLMPFRYVKKKIRWIIVFLKIKNCIKLNITLVCKTNKKNV